MPHRRRGVALRPSAIVALAAVLGLLATLAGTDTAVAKARACKKGYVRNKAQKCVKKAAATTVKRTTSKPTATTAAPRANKGTVLFGTIGTSLNLANGSRTLDENRKMSEAWERQTNAAGGVNGYKVKVLYRDMANDTAKVLQAVKELDRLGVVAIVGPQVGMTPANKYVNDNKIPVVGVSPNYGPEGDQDPMYFPLGSNFSQQYGQLAAARDVGAKHFRNGYCTEVAACAAGVPITRDAAAREGLKFSSQGASAVAADYTANCLSAKDDGVDFFQSNGLNFANLIRDCSRQNYHPTYAQGGAASQATIDAAKGERVAGNLPDFGIFYEGPEAQPFRKALATTDLVTGNASPGQESVRTWTALEMGGAVLKRLNQANPTRAEFLEALYTIKGENLGGMIAPVDYTVQRPGTGLHAGYDCWTEHILKDGKFYHMDQSGQIVTKLTFICGTGHKYVSVPPS